MGMYTVSQKFTPLDY